MGGGGVMTSMRLRLVFSFSFGDLLLLARLWCGVSQSFLVVISGYLLVDFPQTFHTSTMQKPRVFAAFQTKTSQLTPKLNNHKNTKSMVFATLSQKCSHKTRTKNIGKRKARNVVLLTKTSQNTGFSCFRPKKPPKHKRHTPRGGRRTCFLAVAVAVVVVVVVVVVAAIATF